MASTVVYGDALFDPATGETLKSAAVVIEGGRVLKSGRRKEIAVPVDANVVDGEGLTLLPGLIDAHVHLSLKGNGIDFGDLVMTPPSLAVLTTVPSCAATLGAGFTTVRDAGFTPIGVKQAVERGYFPGPRMQVALSVLSQSGGHAENHLPCGAEISLGAGALIPPNLVDGVEPMRQRVRTVLHQGADWIKICTSGGVLSPGDSPHHAQFTLDEIRAAVGEAAAQGKKVMAHAQSAEGVKNALRGGVATIEHGVWLDGDALELMLADGRALVPTLVAVLWVIRQSEQGKMPPYAGPKAKAVLEDHRASIRRAVEAGVTIALGTDSGVGPHGSNGEELLLLNEVGLSPIDCIRSATSVAAQVIGWPGQVGTLNPGAYGDVIGVPGDPVENLKLLANPETVQLVVKGGVVHKHLRPNLAAATRA